MEKVKKKSLEKLGEGCWPSCSPTWVSLMFSQNGLWTRSHTEKSGICVSETLEIGSENS